MKLSSQDWLRPVAHLQARYHTIIKRKFRRSKVSSLSQIVEVVESSTTGGQNKAYAIGNECAKPFAYYDWSEFLSHFFTTLPHITTYYHFRCKFNSPGVVFVHEFADSEEKRFWFSGLISEWIKMLFPLR